MRGLTGTNLTWANEDASTLKMELAPVLAVLEFFLACLQWELGFANIGGRLGKEFRLLCLGLDANSLGFILHISPMWWFIPTTTDA